MQQAKYLGHVLEVRERDAQWVKLEDAWCRFAIEIWELHEAAVWDQQSLTDRLHSKGAQRAHDLQKIGEETKIREETKKQQEAEIQQLLMPILYVKYWHKGPRPLL
ncbi:UNVERIFIED_CONTAM: hypothetical protein K2H54_027021 [Gekko kuhli]